MTTESGDRPRSTLAEKLYELTGRNPAACYQCAKCSAGCPMASERELAPHDILRLINDDRGEEIYAGDSLWICLRDSEKIDHPISRPASGDLRSIRARRILNVASYASGSAPPDRPNLT